MTDYSAGNNQVYLKNGKNKSVKVSDPGLEPVAFQIRDQQCRGVGGQITNL